MFFTPDISTCHSRGENHRHTQDMIRSRYFAHDNDMTIQAFLILALVFSDTVWSKFRANEGSVAFVTLVAHGYAKRSFPPNTVFSVAWFPDFLMLLLLVSLKVCSLSYAFTSCN